jgi:glycine cleavage system H protein
MVPADRRFLESHEWCKLDGDVATVGISAFAVEHLSDLTYLDLPETGAKLEKGERFGEIESVKAVSELFAPISGEVVDVNRTLADSLETLGQDPYERGWMLRVRVSSPAEYATLMDAAAYEKLIAEESE